MPPSPKVPQANPKPLLLGHRGARCYAPENTFAAFDLALAHGCDGFEFDVRLTADSACVVCHDPKLAGTLIATSSEAALRDSWAAAAEKIFRAARALLDPESCVLPTLSTVLFRYAPTAFLDIELKVPGLESLTVSALQQHAPQHGYVVSSFLPEVITRLRHLDPQLPLGLICDRRSQLAMWPRLPISALFLHTRLVSRTLLDELRAAGRQVFVWTVNRAAEMRAYAEMQVDGIISDDTQLLASTLGGAAAGATSS